MGHLYTNGQSALATEKHTGNLRPLCAVDRKAQLIHALRQGLPTLPGIVFALNRQLGQANADLNRAGDLIRTDPSLAAQVLRLSNSIPQAPQARVSKLSAAIRQLGRERLATLVLTSELFELGRNRSQQANLHAFWQHSRMTAQLAERLAGWLEYPDPEYAYMAGLLHDIGMLPYMAYGQAHSDMPAEVLQRETTLEAQREYFGLDHCELGRWIGVSWNFPTALVEACATHHRPGSATEDPLLTGIVAVADRVSEEYGVGLGCTKRCAGARHPEGTAGLLQEWLPELSDGTCKEFAEAAEKSIRELLQDAGQEIAEG